MPNIDDIKLSQKYINAFADPDFCISKEDEAKIIFDKLETDEFDFETKNGIISFGDGSQTCFRVEASHKNGVYVLLIGMDSFSDRISICRIDRDGNLIELRCTSDTRKALYDLKHYACEEVANYYLVSDENHTVLAITFFLSPGDVSLYLFAEGESQIIDEDLSSSIEIKKDDEKEIEDDIFDIDL